MRPGPNRKSLLVLGWLALLPGLVGIAVGEPSQSSGAAPTADEAPTVAGTPTIARAADGSYISWREHIIDDLAVGGVALAGSDGLEMADLDKDGHLDIVSVHESDTTYDGVPDGHVRIAYGSDDPDAWDLYTLAEGEEAGAAEDVAIGDMNGDGYPDVVVACELAHLIYFENPGAKGRAARWERVIPVSTRDRGSYIRVFLADFDDDGRPEVVAANKGGQNPPARHHGDASDFLVRAPRRSARRRRLGGARAGPRRRAHQFAAVRPRRRRRPRRHRRLAHGAAHLLVRERERRCDRVRRAPHRDRAGGRGHRLQHGLRGPERRRARRYRDPGRAHRSLVAGAAGGSGRCVAPAHDRQPRARPAGRLRAHRHQRRRPTRRLLRRLQPGPARRRRHRDCPLAPRRPPRLVRAPGNPAGTWIRHDVSRRVRGMFDLFIVRDMDGDGDVDLIGTRGNSVPYDGVFWLEQVRTPEPRPAFHQAREKESRQLPLP